MKQRCNNPIASDPEPRMHSSPYVTVTHLLILVWIRPPCMFLYYLTHRSIN